MMELNNKKVDKEYEQMINQFKDSLNDFAKMKMEELDIEIEKQQEILREIKGGKY